MTVKKGFDSMAGSPACSSGLGFRSCSSRRLVSRFHLVLLFWYHVLTCVSVSLSASATLPRSATLRYFWQRNLRSRNASCACVNAVLRRRGFLALSLPSLPVAACLCRPLSPFVLGLPPPSDPTDDSFGLNLARDGDVFPEYLG